MNRTRSSWWCRLALALLAVAGFVAPLAQREADGVVQTAGGKPAAVVSPAAAAPLPLVLFAARPSQAPRRCESVAPFGARWLLHRALLL